ncbi:MAG TPA: hypothetical protein VE242_14990 [Chthoniobacterales bacterium]|nr:hypothetical protein [Chthoniobacterales bacterium]
MIRSACFCLLVASFGLTGCDNRTQEDRRWETIAKNQKSGETVQPWKEAAEPWSNENYPTGTAW